MNEEKGISLERTRTRAEKVIQLKDLKVSIEKLQPLYSRWKDTKRNKS
jgi:hypothetical protein